MGAAAILRNFPFLHFFSVLSSFTAEVGSGSDLFVVFAAASQGARLCKALKKRSA